MPVEVHNNEESRIRLILFNLLHTHWDHCGVGTDRAQLDRCVRCGDSPLDPVNVITSNDKDQIPPQTHYFLVLKKSVPCTLVTPFQSEPSAAVDDCLAVFLTAVLIWSRIFILCWWKASEIMCPSVPKCALFMSPFGGSHVSGWPIVQRVSVPAKCSVRVHPAREPPNFNLRSFVCRACPELCYWQSVCPSLSRENCHVFTPTRVALPLSHMLFQAAYFFCNKWLLRAPHMSPTRERESVSVDVFLQTPSSKRLLPPLRIWLVSFMCATRFIYMCDATPICVWYDSLAYATRNIHTRHKTHSLIHAWDMTTSLCRTR